MNYSNLYLNIMNDTKQFLNFEIKGRRVIEKSLILRNLKRNEYKTNYLLLIIW